MIKAAKVKNIPTPSPPRRRTVPSSEEHFGEADENENVQDANENVRRRTNLDI